MNRRLGSPLLLMFILGLGLFLLFSAIRGFFDRGDRVITITRSKVDLLSETFAQTWKRQPTEKELDAQIQNLIREEVLYREAAAIGLDKSDPAVKRRMRQMMELMLDDYAVVYPSEEQLRTFLQSNEETFKRDALITLRHYYFAQEDKGVAEVQLANLVNNRPINEQVLGELSMIPDQLDDRSYSTIERLFGENFVVKVFDLETGRWQGPISSAYGWHLVKVADITPGFVPELDVIWDEVEQEWSRQMRERKKEEQFQKMKEKYVIRVDQDSPK